MGETTRSAISSPFYDDLRGGLAGDRPQHLVLCLLEEELCRVAVRIVVDGRRVEVAYLLVEAFLGGADLADAPEQLVEVILAEPCTLLEPLVVEHEALDDELLQRLRGPDAELRGLAAVDAVADGDDGVEVVEVGQVALAVCGSYPEFPDN